MTAAYPAQGGVTREVAAVAQPLRGPGQYADGETGLCYNYFGYYSPAERRRHARVWNGMPNMQGDLRIPRTGEVLASKVSPTAAFDRLMEWHKEQTAPPTGGSSCSF